MAHHSSPKRNHTPTYRRQRSPQGDRAFVVLNGQRHYLGPYNSAESKKKYHALLTQWEAHGRELPPAKEGLTVAQLCDWFLQQAEQYYRDAAGNPTQELANHRPALKPLLELYEDLPVEQFSPKHLKAVRQRMIETGWSRCGGPQLADRGGNREDAR